ncbi:MAG: hypothetical protein ACOZQL_06640 [Myxococcota bacterium]
MTTMAHRTTRNAKAGDLLQLPMNPGAIWARVLYADAPGQSKRGVYLVVLDRDVAEGDDLAEVARARVLVGPMQTIPVHIKSGAWRIAGNVPLTEEEAQLPYLEDRLGMVNFAGERVEDTPENRARMVQERVAPPDLVVDVARAARGLAPWYPGYDDYRPRREA